MHISKSYLLIILLCFLASCAAREDKLTLQKSNFDKISGWHEDNHAEALASFLKSCEKFESLPEENKAHKSGIAGTYGDWKDVCQKAPANEPSQAREFFETNFTPYLAQNRRNPEGTFTGYYEIELKGSRKKGGIYQYPLYAKPKDLKDKQKYSSREEIENGALKGKTEEIAWVSDPVRLFFLHIQGSGRITMEDGSVMHVGYAGQNNHKYLAIGRYLIDEGYVEKEKMSAQAIKSWLYENPDKMNSVMNKNPSYVFFREIKGEGPIGAQGVPLTPMRSLAIDKRFLPYGAPVWVDVALTGRQDSNEFKRLLVAQDTGGAIKGPVRGDLFFGYGKEAEELAGYQNSKGRYFVLLPRNL